MNTQQPHGIFPNPIPHLIPGDWMVNCYRLAEEVLRGEWRTFEVEPGRPALRFNLPSAGSRLTPRDVHRQRRAEVQRAHFSPARMEGYAREICRRETENVISRLREAGGGDFQRAVLEYTWVVGATLIGIDGLSADEVHGRLAQLKVVPGRVWPDLESSGAVLRELTELLEPSLLRRRSEPRDDLFSTIVAARDDPEELRRDALGWLLVASVNSASAIGRTAYLLEAFPAYRFPDRVILEAVFDESLRLFPVLSYITRKAVSPRMLGEAAVQEGQVVIIDALAANRDEEIFGETAEQFIPGRTLPGSAPRWGLGFGAGPRSCLGEHLAREEALALLQQAYEQGMERAGEWLMGPGPLPVFSQAPVRFPRPVSPAAGC